MDEQLEKLMPEGFREIVDLIGVDKALLFVEAYGGQRVYVPMVAHIGPDHPFSQAIGHGDARRLAEGIAKLKGVEIRPPLATRFRREIKRRAIVARKAEGISTRQLAKDYRCTETHINRILAERKRTAMPG